MFSGLSFVFGSVEPPHETMFVPPPPSVRSLILRTAGRENGELVNGDSPAAAMCLAMSSLVGLRGNSPVPGLTFDPGHCSDAEGGLSASGRDDTVQLNGLCPFDVLAEDGEDSGLAERGELTEFCDEDILFCGDCPFPLACVTGLGVGTAVPFIMGLKSIAPWLFMNVPPKISSNELKSE